MHISSTIIAGLGLFAHLSSAVYTLQDDYGLNGSFFDSFNFFTGPDPTNGFVDYVDRWTAAKSGLVHHQNGSIYIGVENTNISDYPGRQSVRLESTRKYTQGLVILDLAHMPGSVCGSWPAFWMLGSNWPSNGEIDIIEGVNDQTTNQMTLHTSDGCAIQPLGFSGEIQTPNCYVEAPGQAPNSGCAITSDHDSSYGDGFNNAGGGVYATEWTGTVINVWFFPSSNVPGDIRRGRPNPSRWGIPSARFAEPCNINNHFNELQIVFDITFCGDWAGAVWSTSSTCASKASTCNSFVQNNPSAFKETYWLVNSLKVYQETSPSLLDIDLNLKNPSAKINTNGILPALNILNQKPQPPNTHAAASGNGHSDNTHADVHATTANVHNDKTQPGTHAAASGNGHSDNTHANVHAATANVHNDKTQPNSHAAAPVNSLNDKTQVDAHDAAVNVHNDNANLDAHAAKVNVHNDKSQTETHVSAPVHHYNTQGVPTVAPVHVHNDNANLDAHAAKVNVHNDKSQTETHVSAPVHHYNTQVVPTVAPVNVHNDKAQVDAHAAAVNVHENAQTNPHAVAPVVLPGSKAELSLMQGMSRMSWKHRRAQYRHSRGHIHGV